MSNKTKIDISNSKRPPASEINVLMNTRKRGLSNHRRAAATIYVDKKKS